MYKEHFFTVPSGHWTMFKLRIPGNTLASSATAFTPAVSQSSSTWKVKNSYGFQFSIAFNEKPIKNDSHVVHVFQVRLLEVVPTSRTLPALPW